MITLFIFAVKDGESARFLGDLKESASPPKEYLDYANYCQGYDYSFHKFSPDSVQEFSKCLHETNLDSNDVEGIRKVRSSYHITFSSETWNNFLLTFGARMLHNESESSRNLPILGINYVLVHIRVFLKMSRLIGLPPC